MAFELTYKQLKDARYEYLIFQNPCEVSKQVRSPAVHLHHWKVHITGVQPNDLFHVHLVLTSLSCHMNQKRTMAMFSLEFWTRFFLGLGDGTLLGCLFRA